MNQLIKQRINQLNNGEIPNGYKKTSVGIVPIEWTEHTLGDIFKFKNGINKEKEAFGQGTPIVNYTDVWKKRGLKAEDIKGRVVLSKNEIQNYEVKCGDVFFTRTSETIDEIGYSSVLLEDIENTIFSGFVLRARPYNNLVSKEYHQYCYSEPQMRHEIIKRSSMTTRALTSGPMLSQVAINLPSHREQSKIAEILMKWDKAIELYNQYIEKLKQLKSICLKKMFPQKGERVPEWRFKGFTDAWEQRKLGELFSFRYGDGNTNPSNGGQYPVFGAGGIQGGYTEFNAENSIIIGHMGDAGCVSWGDGKHFVTYNGTITKPKNDIFSSKFGYYLLLSMDLRKYRGGSGLPFLTYEMLTEMCTQIPKEKDETRLIAECFSYLDNLITLHQCKVEKIKAQQKVLQKYLLNGIVRV